MGKSIIRASFLLGTLSLGSGCGVEGPHPVAGDTGTESESESGDGETGMDTSAGVPARGISIAEVEFNQGVAVATGREGEWLDGSERNTHLIAGRETLVRVHYLTDPAWDPRELEAVLSLEYTDGGSEALTDRRFIEGTMNPFDVVEPFSFELTPDSGRTQAGVSYRVELREVESEVDESALEGVWANPMAGPSLVGFEDLPMRVEVVIVPVHYTGAGLDTVPEIDADLYRDILMSALPVTEVELSVHAPVAYEEPLELLDDLYSLLSSTRHLDGAEPQVYYQGVIDPGTDLVAGSWNWAWNAGPEPDEEMDRAGVIVAAHTRDELFERLMFNLYRNQGMIPVQCPLTAGNPVDTDYPYPGGLIGVWGYDITTGDVYDPKTTYDQRTRCTPQWVSDYSWDLAFERIRRLSQW